ncbi:carbon-nitrogen hydrolase family protein [Mucilaginibacter segetis]|uniref:Bifunctional GNAT family N-acetyltransferase/carbon-nitrogen hydrolase family protein n=1 Tax=Mucilaginibacter segetis TaxID=2793071 RepID=A0A934ULB5_9SPHI|nr:bifunctional GNAT family N-acetyltransferase/carbon-nitrogen hydrolase family protein [Mucilaginibacter segetis]MBK0377800.1 bifunctional GNAT family N-acetyltransferase/carbon-nitrogen hydrolase family protein [Mucilaginibacter segetis]
MDLQSIELRQLEVEDYQELKKSMKSAYIDMEGDYWDANSIKRLLKLFPEGQICVTVNNVVVGCALSIIVDYDKFGDNHTYKQITGDSSFKTHTDKGDVLYGIEIFVHPDFRGLRLARRLYEGRKALCEKLNLKSIIAGGRIPNYKKHQNELTPRQYIDKVKYKEIYDPILSFQLSNDFHVRKILRNYLPEDVSSKGFATLIEWNNVYFEEVSKVINRKTVVRIGLVQWQMRPYNNISELMKHAEYFIDAVSDYQSDFILFPELFNTPLMAEYNHMDAAQAMRELAKYTQPIVEEFSKLAVSYNVNIIAGSMPKIEDESLYNVSFLFRRNGSMEETVKIHPTPSEISSWGMRGGNDLQVFETDAGKIGILICYDVEFPELSRILASQDMQILFVPFLTDTQNGYNRVKFCAQARAIENECYVAIAGCVGNLPNVNNMDISYAQSAVFTPSDFGFPTNGIQSEATPNTEMIVIADVDLSVLGELHEYGSVQNLKDRRTDLYGFTFNGKKV